MSRIWLSMETRIMTHHPANISMNLGNFGLTSEASGASQQPIRLPWQLDSIVGWGHVLPCHQKTQRPFCSRSAVSVVFFLSYHFIIGPLDAGDKVMPHWSTLHILSKPEIGLIWKVSIFQFRPVRRRLQHVVEPNPLLKTFEHELEHGFEHVSTLEAHPNTGVHLNPDKRLIAPNHLEAGNPRGLLRYSNLLARCS